MKVHFIIINTLLIFLISKYFLKGYKYIPKSPETNNNIPKNKNMSIESKYDYSSPYYIPKNISCESLGPNSWSLLHSVAAIYSNHPNETEKESIKDFFEGLMYFYPSKSELMNEIIKEHPLGYSNREELVYYICQIHNIMNKKLGKKKFSCKEAFNVWGGDCGCND